ncbi:MAG: 16S rRNA (guanine(966)-N(2))-methyltransferase RsmD [Alphaproteobacteria bacterium]|mgnify:CR=1 FL=1|jgi:16S rRNA (guanine966-N2)-methyltransferase|nr:16S rRNA (guanine(966)-N(2))-methyltransferase RsmD [Alphaproteobacteria bacterium]MBT4711881.1 16S rRNA (guanine(966)-N(2))-methyltransferase RsmD [Alphaproteobacteria bacterium]MBT5860280.1 16S rRNA (guanine(966)-N(2))-methyltransferase RsmD [Alphaproteobacteria bacterium]
MAAKSGQIRIIAGRDRGRKLTVPDGADVRPTPDRARESLFGILAHLARGDGHGLGGARVLDAFAGTGALGLEALSRGAERALFLEPDKAIRRNLADNLRALNAADQAAILPRDATHPGPLPAQGPFDLVFADAPYGSGLGTMALEALGTDNWLMADALAVLEVEAREAMEPPEGFTQIDDRTYGRTRLVIFRWSADRGVA